MADKVDAAGVVDGLRQTFVSGKTRPLSYRKAQLRSLLQLLETEEEVLAKALMSDLAKPTFEGVLMEIEVARNAIRGILYDLDGWAADEHVEKNLVTLLDTTFIRREPLGVVLVISAWNYPVQLAVVPIAAAIAAGNTVVFKPTELAPAVSAALKATLESHMDTSVISVVEGGIPETQELLRQRFDHIFFTGGTNVGRIVATAAAANLTPCTLELGGKCPVFFDDDISNFDVAAKRLVWSKCVTLGQTCVAPDYVLCSQKTEQKLVAAIAKTLHTFYGQDPSKSPCLSRIVNSRHYDRLMGLINETKADLVVGGQRDEKDRFMDLHVYTNVGGDDPLMSQELFGPILPIVRADSAEEAVAFINAREKPLSLYIFSENKANTKAVLDGTSSGSACVNDAIVHLSIETLPFGGVGHSGYGAYHGKDSFETFSHRKSVLVRDFGFIGENLGKFRYPPYTEPNMKVALGLLKRRNTAFLPPAKAWLYLGLVCLGAAIGIGCLRLADFVNAQEQ